MRTPIEPEKSIPHLLTTMVNLSVCVYFIPDSVEAMSGVSTSVYPLTAVVMNYLAPMLLGGSLTCVTEDGQSSFVGSVETLASNSMSYFCLLRLHDLSTGSHLWVFSLGLHLLPTCLLWIHAIHLLRIVTSFIPCASL